MRAKTLRPSLRPAAAGAVALTAMVVLSSCGIVHRMADVAANGGETPPPESGGNDEPSQVEDTPADEPPAEEDRDVFDVSVGDCLNDQSETDEVTALPVVDCSETHDSEVIAVEALDSARDYPGDSTIELEADDLCTGDVFEDYIGVPWVESIYETSQYTPTEEGWAAGDYEVICTVYHPSEYLTGSVAGSME